MLGAFVLFLRREYLDWISILPIIMLLFELNGVLF